MQDREIDALFGAKLYDFEVEPSPTVWLAISAELDAGKRKQPFLPILSIAASVLALVAAGILFIPKKGVVNQKPDGQGTIVKALSTPKTTPAVIVTSQPIMVTPKNSAKKDSGTTLAKESKQSNKFSEDTPNELNNPTGSATATFRQLPKPEEQISQVVNPKRQIDIPVAVVPDADIPLSVPSTMADRLAGTSNPQVAAVQIPSADKKQIPVSKQKHKIHNLGDLLNLAIAKVDKRQDKIIEFTDDDDNGSMITAVNLGILKTKKAK